MKNNENMNKYALFIREQLIRKGVTFKEFSKTVGINTTTIYKWNTGCSPYIDTVELALEALGYELKIVKKGN